MSGRSEDSEKQNDTLLWLAGAVVVGMGAIWLVISQPWSSGSAAPPAAAVQAAATAEPPSPDAGPSTAEPQTPRDAQAGLESSLDDNPLRMARLAYEAGMLVEPEEYSAWALYRRALQSDPENVEALEGLETIADELLRRANAAVEQGRFDDARAAVERIRSGIPVHLGANDLAIRLDKLAPRAPRPEPVAVATAPPQPGPVEEPEQTESGGTADTEDRDAAVARAEPTAERAAPAVDPALAPHQAFTAALAENRLLTPSDASAKHYLSVLTSIDAEHELTQRARTLLFGEFLSRAEQAMETLDTDAALTWIDEADLLGADAERVTAMRGTLRDTLIEIESARRLPASELTIIDYTAPVYPLRALERELDGWVDLEFTVGRDGETRDVLVTDASHNNYFRDEAIDAISEWRFEPRVFMGEPIEQRAYTRIRFTFR